MPFCFCRQSSLSDARTDTTMVRWRAFSGVLVVYVALSARCESAGCASVMAAVMASAGESWAVVFFSERTDIARGASGRCGFQAVYQGLGRGPLFCAPVGLCVCVCVSRSVC